MVEAGRFGRDGEERVRAAGGWEPAERLRLWPARGKQGCECGRGCQFVRQARGEFSAGGGTGTIWRSIQVLIVRFSICVLGHWRTDPLA